MAVEFTEYKPEAGNEPLTPEQEAQERIKKNLRMYCASIERERTRLSSENAVRLGDSTFCEKSFIDEIDKALAKIQKKYLSIIE